MADRPTDAHQDIRYEPDERPPRPLLLGLGLQYAVIAMASIMIIPAMMIQLAQGSEAYLSWAVFSALVIGGITTLVQVIRFGRFGSGYILLMGSTSAFLPVCVSALEQGGPGLLASLIIISSFFQFIMAGKLSLLRQIFTPTVAGTAMLLIPVMLGPLIMKKLVDVPEWASPVAAPATAAVTVLAMIVVAIRGSGMLRLWAPIIGMGAGSITGASFGIYDTTRILEATWIGTPSVVWPGFDLSFGPHFWALLPAFVMVTFVGGARYDWGYHRNTTSLVAQTTGRGLSRDSGLAQCRRSGQPALRACWHGAEHDLCGKYRDCRNHQSGIAGGWCVRGRTVRGDCLPA